MPPYHRRRNRVFSAAIRWPDFSVSLCPGGPLPIFSVIQTHPSCRFLLTVDVPGLRRSGSWSQIINQAQDFPEQCPRHRHLGQLERDVPAVANNLGSDLHQLLPQRGQRPVFDFLRQYRLLLMATSGGSAVSPRTSALPQIADIWSGMSVFRSVTRKLTPTSSGSLSLELLTHTIRFE